MPVLMPMLKTAGGNYIRQVMRSRPQKLPLQACTLANEKLWIAIAKHDSEREIGLMFRDELPEREGMLFAFAYPGKYPFWMRNTKIALDLIYFDPLMKITEIIENMQPGSGEDEQLATYVNQHPAQYALELAAGSVAKFGFKVDDKLNGIKL